MKSFYTIFQAVLFFILISNSVAFFLFPKIIKNVSDVNQLIIFILISIVYFLIIMMLINRYFHNPIKQLEITIKKFLVGNIKEEKIDFEKTDNSHINYITSFFSKTLNTLKSIKDEFIHGKEIKWEVELGKEIQWKMLKKKLPDVPSLEVVAKSKPAWEIGWDSYDIIKQDDNYYIYVWDATWHWVWAWFIMIMVNALVSWLSTVYKSWSQILAKTNEIIKPRVKANLLMSMLLVRWNEKEKRLFMTWAWHEYLMIYKHKLWKTFRIKSWWVAIWMIKDSSKLLKDKELSFEPGDIIVLYSDWITEAINRPTRDGSEQIYWEDRLEETINKSPELPWANYKTARWVFNEITKSLSKFMWYRHMQLDDVTLAVIQYKPEWYKKENDFNEEIPKDFITEWNW